MNAGAQTEQPMKNRTTVERASDRELVVTRTFNAPAHIVYEAWTTPELFMQWWVPKSTGMRLVACEIDARIGGGYRLEFAVDGDERFAFFGRYVEVEPNARLAWTNEEAEDGALTTVTFEETDGQTRLVLRERYESKEALEANAGMEDGLPEQFEQLDELLVTLR
jgi:uncharacterized protein YndB with AHSA1/START domain